MLRDQPFTRKLMSVILLTSAVVLALSCGVFLSYELISFRQSMARNLTTLSQIVATNSTAALAFDNPNDASDVLSALGADQHIVSAGLYDRDGLLFAKYPESADPAALPSRPAADGSSFGDGFLVLQQPVVYSNRRLGTLYVKSDLGAIRQ